MQPKEKIKGKKRRSSTAQASYTCRPIFTSIRFTEEEAEAKSEEEEEEEEEEEKEEERLSREESGKEKMLRKRSRAAQDHSKGRLMRDLSTNSSTDSATDQKARSSSFFSVPGLLVSFKGLSESDSTRSPTSPLDYTIFSNLANSFIRSPRSPGRSWDCSRVGLGLVDSLGDDSKNDILLGSQMRLINITNSKKINLAADEQLETKGSTYSQINSSKLEHEDLVKIDSSVEVFDGFVDCLSASEDYTCIISHGPNPKTTHIFGDRILVESQIFGKKQGNEGAGSHWIINGSANSSSFTSSDFLSSCDLCSKKLEEDRDIYMYRGEKAFCSSNCRDQVIIEDESMTEMQASSGSGHFSGMAVLKS